MAGEVDPAQRAALGAHLERCEVCASALVEVQAMRGLFREMAPPAVDDLSWQRMARKIQTELETRAARELPGHGPDLVRWIPAAMVAAGVVAVFVLVTPPPSRAPIVHTQSRGELGWSRVASFELRSTRAELSENGLLRVRSVAVDQIEVDLLEGVLELVTPDEAPLPNIVVTTPEARVWARSRSFVIRQIASEVSVEVREGEARVESAASVVPRTLHAGERSRLRGGAPEASRFARPPAAAGAAPRTEEATINTPSREDSVPDAKPSSEPPPIEPSAELRGAETRVEVTAPGSPSIADAWLAASGAYDAGDMGAARLWASAVIERGGEQPEVALAHELLCRVHLALRAPTDALAACQAALQRQRDPARSRSLHQRIASIYRVQLRDCARAVEHYDRAVVFGAEGVLDEELLLGRADCALELGRPDLAERDLGTLSVRGERLVQKVWYLALQQRLKSVRVGGR